MRRDLSSGSYCPNCDDGRLEPKSDQPLGSRLECDTCGHFYNSEPQGEFGPL